MRPYKESDLNAVRAIYNEAFPPEERADFSWLAEKLEDGRAELYVLDGEHGIAGFAYLVVHADLVYLFYLAIEREARQTGLGSEIVQSVVSLYPDKTVFLARERLDEPCSNLEERKKRRQFYLKNGFHDLPLCIQEGPVIFDVMGTGRDIDPCEYKALMEKWFGSPISDSVPVRMFLKGKLENS